LSFSLLLVWSSLHLPLLLCPAAEPDQMYMIVGFEVSPCSIKRTAGKPIEDIMCDNIDRVPTPQVRQDADLLLYTCTKSTRLLHAS
jgi:hypothetical protein